MSKARVIEDVDSFRAELKRVLDYNEITGEFRWKLEVRYGVIPGDLAGSVCKNKYGKKKLMIKVFGVTYLAHRLAWVYVYGVDPGPELDHINGNSMDNWIKNLRQVTHVENSRNQRKQVRNKTGFTGVAFDKRAGKFVAYIGIGGKCVNIGLFFTLEEAVEARKKASAEHGYHENHGTERVR